MTLSDIDFAALYREAVARTGRSRRTADYWDSRADSMSRKLFDTDYVREFLRRLDLTGCRTLLDVGCGPGTIGLSVADRLDHVYGLDYSPAMLAAFSERARERGLTGATPILRDWDDDWGDVPVCDVVVASRSTAVPDLQAAFLKLESKARVRVYVTYPANGLFVGDEVCRAIGRPAAMLPDCLHAVGILHRLERYPTLDYLPGENRFATCPTFELFQAKVADLLGPLSEGETDRLRAYYHEHHAQLGRERMRWALCSWEAPGRDP